MAKDREITPAHLAKAEKQRMAAQEGARAMADVEKNARAVRINMERLKALRLARAAEEPAEPPAAKPAKKAAAKRAKKS